VSFGGDFEFNLRSFELKKSGQVLKLERIPTDLLSLLIHNRGELVTRDQIVERVWGKDVFLDTDNSINAAIRKIRHVLDDDPAHPRFVQTLTGRGYRFIAAVEESGPTPVAQTPASDSPDSLLGKRISNYRLIRLLGGGGMGLVFEGEDLKLGRRVAIKLLPAELASEPGAFERFEREARAASSLDHPNICSIYQLGEHDGQPFIVMQLLEGMTLREWIEAGMGSGSPARLPELIDYAIQIADGLDAAHQKGIIHRDIKPTNVLVTLQDGRPLVKIIDFGIAKAVGRSQHTRTGALKGKCGYMSPEQARGETVDGRADIFALGIVLHELLTGRRLFKAEDDVQTLARVRECRVPPPSQLEPELPPGLDPIVLKALAKDPSARYAGAQELRLALEEWLIEGRRSASAAHLSEFLKVVYADRLEREAGEATAEIPTPVTRRTPSGPARTDSADSPVHSGSASRPASRRGATVAVAIAAALAAVALVGFLAVRTPLQPLPAAQLAVHPDPERAPEKAPAQRVMMILKSDPAGATIAEGSTPVGTAPHVWSATRGEHRLSFQLAGYRGVTEDVVAASDGQEVLVRLPPLRSERRPVKDPAIKAER